MDEPKEILFRDAETRMLTNLLVSAPSPKFRLPSPIFVVGSRGCGKTVLIKSVINQDDAPPRLYIDCMVCNSAAQITSRILDFLRDLLSAEDTGSKRLPQLNDAAELLRRLFPEVVASNHRIVIVLDGIEHIQKFHSFAPQLFHFQKTEDARIGLVLCSRMPFQSLMGWHCPGSEVMEIFLRNYTKKELGQLIASMFATSKGVEARCVQEYSEVIVNHFYPVTADVRQLKACAQRYFPQYIRPVLEDNAGINDTKTLYKNIIPILSGQEKNDAAVKKTSFSALPTFVRYLLIAGFLCSYNASKFDGRMVAKRHDPVKKAHQSGVKKKAVDKRLTILGPHQFTFKRLFSCLCSLVADENMDVQPLQLQTSLKTLCDQKLFVRVGPEENLDHPKFKCVCEKTFIQRIASSVGMDVNRYLIDLV